MGAAQSLGDFPYKGSVVVQAAAKGQNVDGDVRGNPRYPELVPTAFEEVKTMYDAFQ